MEAPKKPPSPSAAGVLGARRAGILLHPSSLPGPFGIGDLGPESSRFLDWMVEAGLRVWQFLPVGPTGQHHSPYACPSAFAGNRLLISPRRLADAGLLPRHRESELPTFSTDCVDFARVVPWKQRILHDSWAQFQARAPERERRAFQSFVEAEEQAAWLEDWALFHAIKSRSNGASWTTWDPDLRRRSPEALHHARKQLGDAIAFERFTQFVFHRQWNAVRAAAGARSIALFGDVPFYVGLDSSDVWAHQHLFKLDDRGRPTRVAGVPPDYFSETGQLWGNPVYDWARMAEEDYAWWVARIRANLRRVDLLRLDHFRGFAAFWEVDGSEETALNGRWVPGPGRSLFDALHQALGDLPLVAEDLGEITDDVRGLLRGLGLPGMRVLQFGFDDPESEHRPEHPEPNAVVYTGTHDNDTARGWFETLDSEARRRVLGELNELKRLEDPDADEGNVVWRLVEAAYQSTANLAIIPAQDALELGTAARMNVPGITGGNWGWRVERSALTLKLASRLRSLAHAGGRLPHARGSS